MLGNSFEMVFDVFGLSEEFGAVVLSELSISVLSVVLSFVCVSIIWEECSFTMNCCRFAEHAVSSSAASGTVIIPIFTLIFQSAEPFLYFRGGVGNVSLVYRKRVRCHICVRLKLLDSIDRSRKTAAVVDVERNDSLSRKIILVKKLYITCGRSAHQLG